MIIVIIFTVIAACILLPIFAALILEALEELIYKEEEK